MFSLSSDKEDLFPKNCSGNFCYYFLKKLNDFRTSQNTYSAHVLSFLPPVVSFTHERKGSFWLLLSQLHFSKQKEEYSECICWLYLIISVFCCACSPFFHLLSPIVLHKLYQLTWFPYLTEFLIKFLGQRTKRQFMLTFLCILEMHAKLKCLLFFSQNHPK